MPNLLRFRRENLGIGQAELARQVGVSRQALSAVEANKQDPSLPIAIRISRCLSLPMEKLFYAEEDDMETARTTGLTNTERALFANQFRILKDLNRDDDYLVQHYERLETIVERGYKVMYEHVLGELWNELPDEVSNEVFEILDLHMALLNSLGANPSPVDLESVKFKGFDANNESKHLMFAKFYTAGGEFYPGLQIFNSHMPTLDRYRNMLAEWTRMGKKPHLSKAQIESILEAGTFHH